MTDVTLPMNTFKIQSPDSWQLEKIVMKYMVHAHVWYFYSKAGLKEGPTQAPKERKKDRAGC